MLKSIHFNFILTLDWNAFTRNASASSVPSELHVQLVQLSLPTSSRVRTIILFTESRPLLSHIYVLFYHPSLSLFPYFHVPSFIPLSFLPPCCFPHFLVLSFRAKESMFLSKKCHGLQSLLTTTFNSFRGSVTGMSSPTGSKNCFRC